MRTERKTVALIIECCEHVFAPPPSRHHRLVVRPYLISLVNIKRCRTKATDQRQYLLSICIVIFMGPFQHPPLCFTLLFQVPPQLKHHKFPHLSISNRTPRFILLSLKRKISIADKERDPVHLLYKFNSWYGAKISSWPNSVPHFYTHTYII